MSTVLPIRLSNLEKKKAASLAKRLGLPLASYLKRLLQREANRPASFSIGGKAPRTPSGPLLRESAYE